MNYLEYIDKYYLPEKKANLKDLAYYRLYSIYKNHILPNALFNNDMENIKSIDIKNFMVERRNATYKKIENGYMINKNYSQSTLSKIFEFIKNSYSYALDDGIVKTNPCNDVNKNRFKSNVAKKKIIIYTKDEIVKIINEIDTNNKRYSLNVYAIPILLFTGLRVGEVLALRKSDIDLDSGIIYIKSSLIYTRGGSVRDFCITTPKTHSSIRQVPISNNARKYIIKLYYANDSEYLITTQNGNFLRDRNLSRTFSRLCKRIGVRYKGLHSLRHTFATNLILKGLDINIVSKILGHSKTSMTLDVYTHILDDIVLQSYSGGTIDFLEIYGAEGNRTPVQEPVHFTFSHRSQCFNIPSPSRPLTGCYAQ